MKDRWHVLLAEAADLDIDEIVAMSIRLFGPRQARAYEDLMALAIEDLRGGPNVIGSVAWRGNITGLRTLKIARRGRRARHYLVYRVVGRRRIEVLRVLHERMDFARHVPLDPG